MISNAALITINGFLVGFCVWHQFKIRSLERTVRSYETLEKWRNVTINDQDIQEMLNDLYKKISGNKG